MPARLFTHLFTGQCVIYVRNPNTGEDTERDTERASEGSARPLEVA